MNVVPTVSTPVARLRPFARAATMFVSDVIGGRSAAMATVQTVATRTAVLGINVATGMITARQLGATGRGELVAMMAGTWLATGLFTFGLPSATVYNVRRYPESRADLLTCALALSLVVGVVAASIGMAIVPFWLHDYSADVRRHAQWLMLNLPLGLMTLVCTAGFDVQRQFRLSNAARICAPVITLAVLAALAIGQDMTPIRAALAYVAGSAALGWMLLRGWRMVPPRLVNVRQSARRLVGYGWRSWGADVIGTMSLYADQTLVIGLMAPALVGRYSVALSAARVLNAIALSIYSVLFSITASETPDTVLRKVGHAVRLTLIFTAFGTVAGLLWGPSLLLLFYGESFTGSAPVLRILLVETMLSGVTLVLAQSFMALGRPGIVGTLQAVGLASSVPLLLVLIPRYGLVGAGVALLLSTTCRLVFVLVCYPLVLRRSPPSVVPRRADFAPLLAAFMVKA